MDTECERKKKHLDGRLIATRRSIPCVPLSDVAYIHTAKTPEQSLRLLEDSMRNVSAFPTANLSQITAVTAQ